MVHIKKKIFKYMKVMIITYIIYFRTDIGNTSGLIKTLH